MRKMRYNLEWEFFTGGDEDPMRAPYSSFPRGNFFPADGAGSKAVTQFFLKDEAFLQHYLFRERKLTTHDMDPNL